MYGKIFVFIFLTFLVYKNVQSQKIVGGTQTDISKVPYQVAIIADKGLCGGSIILQNWILTAAHCVDKVDPKKIVVRVGTNVYTSGESHSVNKVVVHEKYNAKKHLNDIALLSLSTKIKFSSTKKAIGLGRTLPRDGTAALVSGYGDTSENGSLAKKLMSVTVNIVNLQVCNKAYNGQILSGMFCAAAPKKDSCQGDSGGPLVSNKLLMGVVSWGNGCARPNAPGVYASVPYYYRWITNIAK